MFAAAAAAAAAEGGDSDQAITDVDGGVGMGLYTKTKYSRSISCSSTGIAYTAKLYPGIDVLWVVELCGSSLLKAISLKMTGVERRKAVLLLHYPNHYIYSGSALVAQQLVYPKPILHL